MNREKPHRIPDAIFEKGRKLAENATFYGIPLTDFTREELLAIAAEGWTAYTRVLENSVKRPLRA